MIPDIDELNGMVPGRNRGLEGSPLVQFQNFSLARAV